MIQSRIIGVTGLSGSGTSTVASILEEMGGLVISADQLAHQTMAEPETQEKIIAAFGTADRKKLGEIVFRDPAKLVELEKIIHPRVIAEVERLLPAAENFTVIDAPLLVESGLHKLCDMVLLVTAPYETCIKRIQARDGINANAAARRLASRKGEDFLRPFATYVIENNGDLEKLRCAVLERTHNAKETQ